MNLNCEENMENFIPNISTFLILILILFFANQISAGETEVECRLTPESTKCSDGSGKNIFNFSQIETTTQTLIINCQSNESVNSLPPIDSKKLKNVRNLIIRLCPSLRLRENFFLQSLSLSYSERIDDIFRQLKPLNSLKDLEISYNKIEILKFEFGILIQLTKLNLRNNKIKNITTNSFKACYHLTEIDLSDNAITSLMNKNEFGKITNIFHSKHLPNLKMLNLHLNEIVHVTCSMIPKTVEILDIVMNPLISFTCNEPHLSNHTLKELNLDETYLDRLENCSFPPSIERLSLTYAWIWRLPAKVFTPLKKLKTLALQGNYIFVVDRFTFSSSNGLRSHVEFDLHFNCLQSRHDLSLINRCYNSTLRGIEMVRVHNNSIDFCQIVRMNYPAKYYEMLWKHNLDRPKDVYDEIKNKTFVISDCGNLMLTEIPLTLPKDTTKLYLDGNNLTTVNLSSIFKSSPRVEFLYLNSSNIHHIVMNIFVKNFVLQVLHLEDNFIHLFQSILLTLLLNLTSIYLQNNYLTEFRIEVDELDRLHEDINITKSNFFHYFETIQNFHLENNLISQISRTFCDYRFINLYLDNNKITDVEFDCKSEITRSPLQRLFLQNNNLTVLKSYSFSKLLYLEELHLGGNQIQHVENNAFHLLPQMKRLYLQRNKLKNIGQETLFSADQFTPPSYLGTFSLRWLIRENIIGKQYSPNIDHFNNQLGLIEIHLGGNSIEKVNLSLLNAFPLLLSLDLKNNRIREIISDQSLSLLSLKELHLEENLLTSLHGQEFKELNKVTELYLHQNELFAINKNTFEDMTSLEILTLHGNKLKRLVILQFGFSSILKTLTLHQNPFACDCKYLKQIVTKISFISNVSQVTCLSTENKNYLLEDFSIQFCNNKQLIIGLSVFIGILLMTVTISVLLYRYRLEIQVVLYSRLKVRFFHDQFLDERKPFHAFIAYSCDDREFVAEQLLPGLEKYRLCLHDRNFVVGAFIQENIVNAVNHSACTVIVFSRSFVKSSWCRFEFRTAHDKSLNKGCRPIIVIVLEDVPPDDMEEEMKVYLRTSTYLRWNDQLFWEKLHFALPEVNENDNERNNQQAIPLQQFHC